MGKHERKLKKKAKVTESNISLYQVLDRFKNKEQFKVSFNQLDKLLQNIGRGQFNYETFKSAYDSDAKIKNLVKNFDREGIELKSSEMDDLPMGKKKDPKAVSKMAKRAVDLKDL